MSLNRVIKSKTCHMNSVIGRIKKNVFRTGASLRLVSETIGSASFEHAPKDLLSDVYSKDASFNRIAEVDKRNN